MVTYGAEIMIAKSIEAVFNENDELSLNQTFSLVYSANYIVSLRADYAADQSPVSEPTSESNSDGSGEENEALDEEVELNMMGVRRFNTMDTIFEEEVEGIEETIEEDIEFEEYYGEHKEDNRAEEDEE